DEAGDVHVAMAPGEPAAGGDDMRVGEWVRGREKREDAIGGGGSVTAEILAGLSGFVGVDFGGGEEEASVAVLAALDEDAGGGEDGVGVGGAGSTKGVEDVAGHGEIDVPRGGRCSALAAQAP